MPKTGTTERANRLDLFHADLTMKHSGVAHHQYTCVFQIRQAVWEKFTGPEISKGPFVFLLTASRLQARALI